jgi:putative membrane protein
MIRSQGISLFVALALSGAAWSQTPPPKANQSAIDTASEATNPHKHDMKMTVSSPAEFVQQAALAGMTEVELSKLALKQTKVEDIRKFADRMVQDHGKANMELASLAKTKKLDAPKQLDAAHRKMVDDLASKKSTEFDATYAQHMAMGHANVVQLFENASSLPDPELSKFARSTLPTLQQHLQMAEALHSKVRASSDVQPPK